MVDEQVGKIVGEAERDMVTSPLNVLKDVFQRLFIVFTNNIVAQSQR